MTLLFLVISICFFVGKLADLLKSVGKAALRYFWDRKNGKIGKTCLRIGYSEQRSCFQGLRKTVQPESRRISVDGIDLFLRGKYYLVGVCCVTVYTPGYGRI